MFSDQNFLSLSFKNEKSKKLLSFSKFLNATFSNIFCTKKIFKNFPTMFKQSHPKKQTLFTLQPLVNIFSHFFFWLKKQAREMSHSVPASINSSLDSAEQKPRKECTMSPSLGNNSLIKVESVSQSVSQPASQLQFNQLNEKTNKCNKTNRHESTSEKKIKTKFDDTNRYTKESRR